MAPCTIVLLLLAIFTTFCCQAQQCPVVVPNPQRESREIRSNKTKLNWILRIVNGHIALPGTRRHMASFHKSAADNSFCSGSLISARWVLTAAHCKIKTTMIVRLGGGHAQSGVSRRIMNVINHPDFGSEKIKALEIYDDDIALVKLSQDAPSLMRPILINENKDLPRPRYYARVAGYGITSPDQTNTGILRSVDVPIKSSVRCALLYAGTLGKGGSTGLKLKDRAQFCAGYKDGHCDSCEGDSGGPLFVYNPQGHPVQIGITSFGISCALEKRPGVYVRLSYYVPWMKKNGAVFNTTLNGMNHEGSSDEKRSFLDSFNPMCFPADSKVTMVNGTQKPMYSLQVGDKVLTSNGVFSEVFMFTHRMKTGHYPFIVLSHSLGEICSSHEHYVYINGKMKLARLAKIGDFLELANSSMARITKIRHVVKQGLYNPQTITGTIIVDGAKASTYTNAIPPAIAHPLLRPLAALSTIFFRDLCTILHITVQRLQSSV